MSARVVLTLSIVLGLLGPALASPAPNARDVVVRGGGSLDSLLERAMTTDGQPRPVALVLDVSPNTRSRGVNLGRAIDAFGDRVLRLDGHFRIAALGGQLGAVHRHPSGLLTELAGVLATETPVPNTIAGLRKTLSGFDDAGGLVVYLADWRFEEDDGIEPLIARLESRGQSLSVIGSEAAFERAFVDGFFPMLNSGDRSTYEPGIGRSPFGPPDWRAPWRGGDTAWPHFPQYFLQASWQTTFPLPPPELPESEDLSDRLQRPKALPAEADLGRLYPLPSSWGPYGLMRLAGATGGKYFLASFNPAGRTDVVYDYARCNQYPPDLRSRGEILADTGRRPFAGALIRAWNLIANDKLGIADVTAPLRAPGAGPREMEYAAVHSYPHLSWRDKADYRQFLKRAETSLEALDRAIAVLERVLGAPAADDVDARYRADAELLSQILTTLRFQVQEAVEASRAIPDALWENGTTFRLQGNWLITPGRDLEHLELEEVRTFQPEEAQRILAARRAFLTRYLGTPFGELARRNGVLTYQLSRGSRIAELEASASRTPSESTAPTKTTPGGPGGGSSGGGGSSSGK